MKPGSILFLFSFLILNTIHGQAPDIMWQRSYGGSLGEAAYQIAETADSGFILFGSASSVDGDVTENKGIYDYWIVKLDANQNIEWQKTFGGSNMEYPKSGLICPEGGYLILGYIYSSDGDITSSFGGSDFWLVKVDDLGNLEWERSYGGSSGDDGKYIINSVEGGFIMVGATVSSDIDVTGNHGGNDVWVVKLDDLGNIVWQKCYGGSNTDEANSIAQTPDGGYIIAGKTESNDGDVSGNHGFADYWVIKIDAIGNLIWENSYGGSLYDIAFSIKSTIDNGSIVVGQSDSNNGDVSGLHGSHDYWVVKLDSLGGIDWQHALGGTAYEEGKAVTQEFDDGYLVAGYSGSGNGDLTVHYGDADWWVAKLSLDGTLEWQKTLGSSETDEAFDIIVTSDSNIVVAGYNEMNDFDVTGNHGSIDAWIVKLGYCTDRYFADADGDGFGDMMHDSTACNVPVGYVADSTDCNDGNNTVFPGAVDICNALDDNCNGSLDEDAVFTLYYADMDGDGFGNVLNDSLSCAAITGYVADTTDCNDTNNLIYPGAAELCNYLDDDCNGIIDDNLALIHSFEDADGDDYGNSAVDTTSCLVPEGYVENDADCNDANAFIYPGAPELLNGIDDNCNQVIDEGLMVNDALLSQLKIYPNPAAAILYIEYTGSGTISFEIIDITGKTLLDLPNNSGTIKIDIAAYAAGAYLLKINSLTGQTAVVFVKE